MWNNGGRTVFAGARCAPSQRETRQVVRAVASQEARMFDKASGNRPNSGGWIANLGLTTKTTAGFLVVIAVFLAVIGLAYGAFVKIGHQVEEMEVAAEELALVSNVELQFLKMTRAAREFVQKGDAASERQANKHAQDTRAALAAAKAGISVASHRAKIDEITTAFEHYVEGFAEVAKLQHEHDTYISEHLDPTGDRMIADLDKLIDLAKASSNLALENGALEIREYAFRIQVYAGRFLLEGKAATGLRRPRSSRTLRRIWRSWFRF
jgi:hypothetical protein